MGVYEAYLRGWLTPARRRWMYAIAAAITALLGVYGVLSAEQISAWNLVMTAVFGVAFMNVNDDPDTEEVGA